MTDDAIEQAGLARLDAAFGAEWDLWHDRGSGLWWAWSEQRRVRLAADSPEGSEALLAELAALPREES